MQEIVYVECDKIHITMAKTYKGLCEVFLEQHEMGLPDKLDEAQIYQKKATSILEDLNINKTAIGELQAIQASIEFNDGDLKNAEKTWKKALQTIKRANSDGDNDDSWKRNSTIPLINASLAEIVLQAYYKDGDEKSFESALAYAKEIPSLYEETYGADELEDKLNLPTQALALDLSAKIMLESIVEKKSFEKAYSYLSDAFSSQSIKVRISQELDMKALVNKTEYPFSPMLLANTLLIVRLMNS